jgi:hypothetical protein
VQVFVLGMHRSGTSTVTRLLNMAGAYFGPEGISNGADEGNLKGFWERVDVRAACDGLLQESGFDWWKVADFSLDRIPESVRARHVGSLERILLELDAHRPWVIKEPRLSLLFPLVRPLLEVPICVHVTREPLEIADSLQTRNGFPAPAGLALWELYTIRAFEASAGLPRVLVRYEEVMSTPVATLAHLVERLTDLGVFGLRVPTEREITAYIDVNLHRERRSPGDRRWWMNEQQLTLAAETDDGTVIDDRAVSREVSDGALAQLRALEEGQVRRAQVGQLQDEIKVLRMQLDALQGQADAANHRIAIARNLLGRASRQVRSLSRSRAWRLAWRAAKARRRLLRAEADPESEPLQQVRSTIDQVAQQLQEPGSDTTSSQGP